MSTSLTTNPRSSSRIMVEFPKVRDVFEHFNAVTDAIAKEAFSLFQQRGGTNGKDWDDWLRAESELLRPVPIEMTESNDSYVIRAEVPGFDAKELNIQVEPNYVHIHGKAEQTKENKKDEQVKYSEVSARELCRRIDLPTAINPDKVSASLEKGVLELHLAKASPSKSIEVKAA